MMINQYQLFLIIFIIKHHHHSHCRPNTSIISISRQNRIGGLLCVQPVHASWSDKPISELFTVWISDE